MVNKKTHPVTLEEVESNYFIQLTESAKKIRLNKAVVVSILTFIAGFSVGLFMFGWWLWPVEWVVEDIYSLPVQQKIVIYETLAENLSITNNTEEISSRIGVIDRVPSYNICLAIAADGVSLDSKARLLYLQYALNLPQC